MVKVLLFTMGYNFIHIVTSFESKQRNKKSDLSIQDL